MEHTETKKRVKRRRPESVFLSDFGRCWKAAGGYWYKIPDVGGQLARFAPPRPYDVNAAMNGIIFVIEAKYCKTINFGLSEMRPHQIPELVFARQAGYQAFVLVCYQRQADKIADFFRIETLVQAQRDGRKYLAPTDAALRIYAMKKGMWDIRPQSISNMVAVNENREPELFSEKA